MQCFQRLTVVSIRAGCWYHSNHSIGMHVSRQRIEVLLFKKNLRSLLGFLQINCGLKIVGKKKILQNFQNMTFSRGKALSLGEFAP